MHANCQLMGIDIAFPDVCKTPPAGMAPLPYMNLGFGNTAIPNIFRVYYKGGMAHNLMTRIPITIGDTPGAGGGALSQTVMAQSCHVMGCATFWVQGLPVTKTTHPTSQNAINARGVRTVSSQWTVLALAA